MESTGVCVVCNVQLQDEQQVAILNNTTKHTATPLQDVVSAVLPLKLKESDCICNKCLDLFNEKDRLQKMTTDMDSHILTKVKDSSKNTTVDLLNTISITVGEPQNNSSISEELDRQFKCLNADALTSQPLKKTDVEEPQDSTFPPPTAVPKKRKRGRKKSLKKDDNNDKEEKTACKSQIAPPPLMVNERQRRKPSAKFNTFLEVLRGEKDFYIDDDMEEEPKSKSYKRTKRKRRSERDVFPVEDQNLGDNLEKMCIIQVTEMGSMRYEVNVNDKDRTDDTDEVVQEIFDLTSEEETSLIHDIENLETDGELMNVINEMASNEIVRTGNGDEADIDIKEEQIAEEDQGHHIKLDDSERPTVETEEIDDESGVPNIEVTITQTDNDTLSAVVCDSNVHSNHVEEHITVYNASGNKEKNNPENKALEERKYRCRLCTKFFPSKETARKHAQDHHMPALSSVVDNVKESFKCRDCDRSFPTAKGRDRHHLCMHPKYDQIQCPECPRQYIQYRPLERHLRVYHDKNPLHHCDHCDDDFVLANSLEHHIEKAHPLASVVSTQVKEKVKQTKVSVCPFCNKKFQCAKALKLHHEKEHKDQEYNCKYCKHKSNNLSSLNRHMVNVHKALNLEIFHCLCCKAGYQDPKALEDHYLSAHKRDTSYHCQHCGAKFACVEMLRLHRRSHRAFSCKLCHLGFMRETTLEEHLKTVHTHDPASNAAEGASGSSQETSDKNSRTLVDVTSTEADTEKSKEEHNPVLSQVLVIDSDGTLEVGDDKKDEGESAAPIIPSEDVTLHLQRTREGGLEEMDVLNPLKGLRIKDLPKKMNCPVCHKVLTTAFLRTHMLSHKGTLPHKCHVCSKAYAQGTLLRKHMKNRHYEEFLKLGNKNPKKRKIECEFCQGIYDDIYTLEEHLWLHMDEKTYECSDCKIKFGMASNLREHYKSHYFKEAEPCPICKREFKSIGFYNEHVERCTKRWKCEQCGIECETQEYYRKHRRHEHGDETVVRYQCTLCEKSFVERHRFHDHIITHSSEKRFTCHLCEKQFKRQRPLNDHLVRVHSDGKFMCNSCRQTFRTQQELKSHKEKHDSEYVCTVCGYVGTSYEAVLNHRKAEHSEALAKSYVCHVCNQIFAKMSLLKVHMTCHNNNPVVPFTCQVDGCNKSFRTENLLKNHMTRRHQEAQYACSVCNRKFTTESDRVRHMSTHSGVSVLSCGECGCTFRSEANLEWHLLTHTDEKPYECEVCQHTAATKQQILHHVEGEHDIRDVASHVIVNRWCCSVCNKMFVVRSSLLHHLKGHSTEGLDGMGHSVKTRSTPSFTEFSAAVGLLDNGTSFLEQASSLSWQDLTPLLRLHILSNETEDDETAASALPANLWQCPGCLEVEQSEEDMRDHLISLPFCQEAVIFHIGQDVDVGELGEDVRTEETLLDEGHRGAVLQLTESSDGMQYVIVQENEDPDSSEGSKDNQVGQQVGEGDMQVLVSVDENFQHLLQEQTPANIQIVVDDSTPLKQLLEESSEDCGQPAAVEVNTPSHSQIQDGISSGTGLLNVSEVLLQTPDGRLLLQQTVGGVTQYQLVEGVVPSGDEDSLTLLPSHNTSIPSEYAILQD